jgi:hypothetical protein
MPEAVELVKAEVERARMKARIHTPRISPTHVLTVDVEFEGVAECDAFWSQWMASPEGIAFLEKWIPLVESDGIVEIWDLEE